MGKVMFCFFDYLKDIDLSLVAHAEERKFAPVYDDEVSDGMQSTLGSVCSSCSLQTDSEIKKNISTEVNKAQSKIEQLTSVTRHNIEKYTKSIRVFLNENITHATKTFDFYTVGLRNSERAFVETVASLKGKNEQILPGSIYILVAGLGASILVRRRNFLVRAVIPWAVGIGAFNYYLPQTFENTRKLGWKYEVDQFPNIAKHHETAVERAFGLKEGSLDVYKQGEKQIIGASKGLRDLFREWTGL